MTEYPIFPERFKAMHPAVLAVRVDRLAGRLSDEIDCFFKFASRLSRPL